MTSIRERGERIRRFIVSKVQDHPGDIASVTAKKFDISRQAANKHLARLVDEAVLESDGATRNRRYRLKPTMSFERTFDISKWSAEDVVWVKEIRPHFQPLPDNAMGIWSYGFTEMYNNAVDHSKGRTITIEVTRTAAFTELILADDGEGIFRKITRELDLLDERHAVLELAKGKLTTDPANHTGEDIFFTSRMFDEFAILSGDTCFTHTHGELEDWILETPRRQSGTFVFMKLNNHTSRTARKVFDRFTDDDDFGFSKTIVPVRMACFGDERLVSRSQAKRMLARVDRFSVVIFDFKDVQEIGQAFADEVFRVFARKNPEIELRTVNANSAVKRMITRARLARVQRMLNHRPPKCFNYRTPLEVLNALPGVALQN